MRGTDGPIRETVGPARGTEGPVTVPLSIAPNTFQLHPFHLRFNCVIPQEISGVNEVKMLSQLIP